MQIVNFFYEIARQHRRIKGFAYGKGYEKGAGMEMHPLIWLDDPILGQSVGNTIRYTVNVDVLGVPKKPSDAVAVQTEAFNVGMGIIERIKTQRASTGVSLDSFSFITLRDYYDNNAAGVRFTMQLITANPVDRCADDFDPTKQLGKIDALPNFDTDAPDGCAIFNNSVGLPDFKLSI